MQFEVTRICLHGYAEAVLFGSEIYVEQSLSHKRAEAAIRRAIAYHIFYQTGNPHIKIRKINTDAQCFTISAGAKRRLPLLRKSKS